MAEFCGNDSSPERQIEEQDGRSAIPLLKDDLDKVRAEEKEPLHFSDKSRALLREACSKGKECDPLGPNASAGHTAYMSVADFLEKTASSLRRKLFFWSGGMILACDSERREAESIEQ